MSNFDPHREGHLMIGPLLIITGLATAIYCAVQIYSGDRK